MLYDGPQWHSTVADEVSKNGKGYTAIMMVYLALIIVDWSHMLTLFYVSRESGAVVGAVNKSVQSVSVFLASHIFYCGSHDSQCLTAMKGISMTIVIGGVLLYGYASAIAPPSEEDHDHEVPFSENFSHGFLDDDSDAKKHSNLSDGGVDAFSIMSPRPNKAN